MAAYLLITHGSRDPRPQAEAGVLAHLVAERLQNSALGASSTAASTLVGTAVLELHALPLHQQIQQVAEQAIAAGHNRLVTVPLFLLPGVHVLEDLPAEMAIARTLLPPGFMLDSCPYLGSYLPLQAQFNNLLNTERISGFSASRILLSHGSRRPSGNLPVEAIATQLSAISAYWSTSPKLDEQVSVLIQHGCEQIDILPYFLFEGKITDAIAQMVEELALQFPEVALHLAKPLGATPTLANLIVNLIQSVAVTPKLS